MDKPSSLQAFTLPFANTVLHGDHLTAPATRQQLLLLHGAGQAQRAVYTPLRQHLAGQGVSSMALDFVGHGDTGGELIGSSLSSRVAQASRIAELAIPRALLGSSMGSYIAIHLLERFAISHLVLQVPGVYTPRAFDVPFGPAFTAILRQPDSWRETDAWARLSHYQGHLLIVAAACDEVIPHGIVEQLYDSASHAASRQLLKLEDAGHQLGQHWQRHPARWPAYAQQISQFLLLH